MKEEHPTSEKTVHAEINKGITDERVLAEADSHAAESCLKEPDIHRDWISAYRSSANERFFSLVFDFIGQSLRASADAVILDAGCGSCAHSIRLAQRGFKVRAVDISEEVIRLGRQAVRERGLADKIEVGQANLRSLPFADGQFSGVLCWGVLMHVPEVKRALSELCRVVASGGILVIGENNVYSLQSLTIWFMRKLLKRNRGRVRRVSEGLETWYPAGTAMLFTRITDMGWLIAECSKNGLSLKRRVAGQASDLYTWFSSPVSRRLIHRINLFWFKYLRIPYPAYGNILIFQKQ